MLEKKVLIINQVWVLWCTHPFETMHALGSNQFQLPKRGRFLPWFWMMDNNHTVTKVIQLPFQD
jgi:hypothetical protein